MKVWLIIIKLTPAVQARSVRVTRRSSQLEGFTTPPDTDSDEELIRKVKEEKEKQDAAQEDEDEEDDNDKENDKENEKDNEEEEEEEEDETETEVKIPSGCFK